MASSPSGSQDPHPLAQPKPRSLKVFGQEFRAPLVEAQTVQPRTAQPEPVQPKAASNFKLRVVAKRPRSLPPAPKAPAPPIPVEFEQLVTPSNFDPQAISGIFQSSDSTETELSCDWCRCKIERRWQLKEDQGQSFHTVCWWYWHVGESLKASLQRGISFPQYQLLTQVLRWMSNLLMVLRNDW